MAKTDSSILLLSSKASTPKSSSLPVVEVVGSTQCVDFTVQDGRIYYTNRYDNGRLYSINIDGSENHKINDDRLERFYISKDQIYYVNNSDGGKLYTMNTDGSGRRKLSNDQIISVFWNVADSYIYYSNWDDDSALYRIKTDGSGRKKLSDDKPLYAAVLGERIFYYSGSSSGGKGIYSIKTDGSDKLKLSDDNPFRIVAADGWIYYIHSGDDYKLYTMRTDGSDRRKLSDDYTLYMNVLDGRIYYKNGNDQTICSINVDGSDKQVLSDDHASWLALWDKQIYYMITGANIYSMNVDGSDKLLIANLDQNAYQDLTYEVHTSLHEEIPEYRFVATGMTQHKDEGGIGYVMGLDVFDEKGLSILSADFSELYEDEVTGNPVYNEMMDTMGLQVVDVNFDGYKDVIILESFAGAHGNTWYLCWLWDPKRSSFVASETFAEICNPALDADKKCIYSAGGSGAASWGGSIYQYINGEFVMTNNLDTDWDGLTETELINGEMVIVRKVSYTAGDEDEAAEMEYYKNSEFWQLDHPRWYWVGGQRGIE